MRTARLLTVGVCPEGCVSWGVQKGCPRGDRCVQGVCLGGLRPGAVVCPGEGCPGSVCVCVCSGGVCPGVCVSRVCVYSGGLCVPGPKGTPWTHNRHPPEPRGKHPLWTGRHL